MPHKTFYVPALRFKQGEYRGLERLAADVADRFAPRLVMPPPTDRDPEKKRPLTQDEVLHLTGRRIGQHWRMRPAFLETRFLFAEFGEAESLIWLPRIFEVARNASAVPIPVATLDDMLGVRSDAFRRVLAHDRDTKIAVRVQSGEIGSDLAGRTAAAMSQFGITPESCALMLDFADADFSNVEAVAVIAGAALEDVQAIGRWKSVIFQGTNYPDKNPATEDSFATVARNEWLAWKIAVQNDTNASAHLIFGDYCADSANFEFRSGGGALPIRHYRYCTADSWLVVRGKSDIPPGDAMRGVSQFILDRGVFAGRDFSSADEYIYGTAKGYDGPGSPTSWREINTAHHITQVVSDIGRMRGFSVERRAVVNPPTQTSLFDPEAQQIGVDERSSR
jgi:hypothetical protein